VVDIGLHYAVLNGQDQPNDSDQDGIPDYFEDTNGNGIYAAGDLSDWMDPDTDNDELPDGWELRWFIDPFSSVAAGDPDTDGLSNVQEYHLNLDPTVNQAAQSANRRNYIYDRLNRLDNVTGVGRADFTLDKEGNITNVAP
jgi:hypothetical protein